MHARTRNIEIDNVGHTRSGIGIEDGLTQRTGAAVVGVGDGVGCEQATVRFLEVKAKGDLGFDNPMPP